MTQAQLPGMPAVAYGDENDHWSTPRWAIDAIVPVIARRISRVPTKRWVLLDPGCGRGAIMQGILQSPIRPSFHTVMGVELNPEHAGEARAWLAANGILRGSVVTEDFIEFSLAAGSGSECEGRPMLVAGNPPYNPEPPRAGAMEFVERSITMASPTGGIVAMLLQHDFATGVDRSARIHDKWPSGLYPLRRRPEFGPDGGSGKRPFSWFVWDLGQPYSEWRVIG